MADSPWLSDEQQAVWRSWIALSSAMPVTLHRALQAQSGLSLPDFEVLVALTDSPEGRLRVTDLANQLNWERSRVSHHVARMERRELVERQECPDDGRGAFIVITETGRTAIESAAPSHARLVRELVFDHLTQQELKSLGRILTSVRARTGA